MVVVSVDGPKSGVEEWWDDGPGGALEEGRDRRAGGAVEWIFGCGNGRGAPLMGRCAEASRYMPRSRSRNPPRSKVPTEAPVPAGLPVACSGSKRVIVVGVPASASARIIRDEYT